MQDQRAPESSNQLPGLHKKDDEEDPRDFFKSWEDWERAGRLHDVFRWKTVNKQEKPVLPAVVEGEDVSTANTERTKSARGKAKKLDTKCREEVDRVVLKVLQRKKRNQGTKRIKEAVIETKKAVWQGVRDVASETPVASKAQRKAEKKRRFAEVRYFCLIGENCEAVRYQDVIELLKVNKDLRNM